MDSNTLIALLTALVFLLVGYAMGRRSDKETFVPNNPKITQKPPEEPDGDFLEELMIDEPEEPDKRIPTT